MKRKSISNNIILLLVFLSLIMIRSIIPVWTWKCEGEYCKRKLITNETIDIAVSLAACKLLCSSTATLWPKPTGNIYIGNSLEKININNITIKGFKLETASFDLFQAATRIFKEEIRLKLPKNVYPIGGKQLVIIMNIKNLNINKFNLDLIESYTLKLLESSDGSLKALITADNFFGARHALTTLTQLIIYDDIRENLQIPENLLIKDKPMYPHRGILLDTSRNYITVNAIKRVIKGMGASKLNTLHWHITDSHSFPYVSKSQPTLAALGAYSPSKVYRPNDVDEILRYAIERGVQLVPEFDAPAHVGEGWQTTNFVTCFNWQPWQDYCFEPPCGQFDPTKKELYDVIEDIYGDMLSQFKPNVFHMGGDEVNFNCWNNTMGIVEWMSKHMGLGRSERDFIELWNYFQEEALKRLHKKAKRQIPAIVWTSQLTQNEFVLHYLPKEKYIIQVQAKKDSKELTDLLNKGYMVILSNYDALYLNCGFAGWYKDGNNWCSPYIGWQKIYENKPANIADIILTTKPNVLVRWRYWICSPQYRHLTKMGKSLVVRVTENIATNWWSNRGSSVTTGGKNKQILGAEVALWTEQFNSAVIDSRLWPRAAALAEVLWTEPKTDWKAAKQRFLQHRERLVTLGLDADGNEPEWCLQNEGNCQTVDGSNIDH